MSISAEQIDEAFSYLIDNYKDSTTYGFDIDVDELDEHDKRLYEVCNLYLGIAESRMQAKHSVNLELVIAGYGSFLWGFGDLGFGWVVSSLFCAFSVYSSYHNFRFTRHLKLNRENDLTRKLLMRRRDN